MSELLWVAVPGGALREGEAVLRVLVVPRLSGLADGADLSSSVMADWPRVLAATTLTIRTADAPGAASVVHEARRLDLVRAELWPRMFPPTMPVRSFQPPGNYAAPEVDATADDNDTIVDLYRTAAANPGDAVVIDRRLTTTRLATRSTTRRGPGEVRAPAATEPDFHRVTTMLREHPAVLQALGLVVELRLPDPSALGSHGLISVEAQLTGPAAAELTSVAPTTSYLVERGRFLPAPEEGSDLALGMLDLSADHWRFATFDVTGAAQRLTDAVPSQDAPGAGTTTLPALRSSGLNLLWRGRQHQLERRAETARRNGRQETLADTVLFADDLVLGYRVDVRTDVGTWSSLMRRAASYTTQDQKPIVAEDHVEEGQVKANAATVDDPADMERPPEERRLRSDEVVARWDGWSLTCPRVLPGPRPPGPQLAYLRWNFSPVGLPELRFGTEYRMRVRIADAAGGGLGPDEPDHTEGESREVFYGRHDPVPPPFLVPPIELLDAQAHPAKLGPGGALDVVVIRSNPATGETVEDYAARYPRNDRRLFLPPTSSFRLAEEHGNFDSVDQTTAAALLRRATTPPEHDLDGNYSWLPDPVAEGVAFTVLPTPGVAIAGDTAREAWTNPEAAWPDFSAKTVHVEPLTSPRQRPLDWTAGGRSAVVRLAPGTQLDLAVTSTVANDRIDRFAMHNWLTSSVASAPGDLLDDVMDLVRTGRHPMVSPPTPLRVVHAVKQPVRPPGGTMAATRDAGDTAATLIPSPPLLGLDPPSTGQVALSATWTEVADDQSTPIDPVDVQVSRLGADATTLPPLHHELGDTKHRLITYTLRATTRYRDFFDVEPDAAFQTTPLEQTVDVPSTAPPPAPVVTAVYPAFQWTDTEPPPPNWQVVERLRKGGRLRVELARPWHLSGADEWLGIVLGPDPTIPRRWTTTIRRDPIWPSPPPEIDPTWDLFEGWTGQPHHLPLPGTQQQVEVLAYVPHFAPPEAGAPGFWYIDVGMPAVAETTYCPFVHLALVRYQPHSLPGCHISPVVRAEPAQLLPDRRLTVERRDGAVTVRLDGLTPSRNQDADLGDQPDEYTHPPEVWAYLEQWTGAGQPTDLTATRVDLPGGWQRIASVNDRVGSTLPPLPLPADGRPLRLVVREVERFMQQTAPPTHADQLNERAVFVDVVDLT